MPKHINSCVLYMCLLFNLLLLIGSYGTIYTTSGIRVRLGFNPLNTVKMSSTKYDVEKFFGKENFSLWQRRMKDLLIQQGVHKALLGNEKKLETMKDVEWVEMDEKAVSAICLNLGDEVIHNILEAKTAKEFWEKLESLYMRKNLTNKLYVKKQLYSLHMKEGSDLLEHLNTFNMLNTQLSSFRVNYEDEDKALLLLASLSTSFDHLVTTWMYGK